MEDWLKILIPVVLSSIISVIITLVNNASNKRKNARKVLMKRRLSEIQKLLMDIKEATLKMEFQLIDFSEGLKQYFIVAGNLQIYLENNRKALKEERRIGKMDPYRIDDLDRLGDTIHEVGTAMFSDKTLDIFEEKYKDGKIICDKLISHYNQQMVRVEYL